MLVMLFLINTSTLKDYNYIVVYRKITCNIAFEIVCGVMSVVSALLNYTCSCNLISLVLRAYTLKEQSDNYALIESSHE